VAGQAVEVLGLAGQAGEVLGLAGQDVEVLGLAGQDNNARLRRLKAKGPARSAAARRRVALALARCCA
jgi:hypothetical protein